MDSDKSDKFQTKTHNRELQIELDSVSSQNSKLSDEIAKLRAENTRLVRESNTSSGINIEMKMQLFKSESECEELKSALNGLKKRYNKLHDSYLEKKKTSSTVKDYVKKNYGDSNTLVRCQNDKVKFCEAIAKENEFGEIAFTTDLTELETKLKDAYDVIDELEFELESVTTLEIENERLRNKLTQLTGGNDLPIVTSKRVSEKTESTRDSARYSDMSYATTSRSSVNSMDYQVNNVPDSAKPQTTGNNVQTLMSEIQNFKFKNSLNKN